MSGQKRKKKAFKEAPVYTPTFDEFCDFEKYINSICEDGHSIVKIRAPKEWLQMVLARFGPGGYENVDGNMILPTPIRQEVQGVKGLYSVLNMEKEPLTLREFRQLALKEGEQLERGRGEDGETPEDKAERLFWRNITFQAPMYAADIPGSLFAEDFDCWNVAKLPSLLNKYLDEPVPGVNTPYLYFGMWKAMFCWHAEDMNLFSINYLHFGEPKHWYALPPSDGPKFEETCKGYYTPGFRLCNGYLRHKTTAIAPSVVKSWGMDVVTTIQEPGDFIITFPYAYHCGFNRGFNCAESTNFATRHWIPWGLKSAQDRCLCHTDMVRIDMDIFLEEIDTSSTLYKKYLKAKEKRRKPAKPPPSSTGTKRGRKKVDQTDENEKKTKKSSTKKKQDSTPTPTHTTPTTRRTQVLEDDEEDDEPEIDLKMAFRICAKHVEAPTPDTNTSNAERPTIITPKFRQVISTPTGVVTTDSASSAGKRQRTKSKKLLEAEEAFNMPPRKVARKKSAGGTAKKSANPKPVAVENVNTHGSNGRLVGHHDLSAKFQGRPQAEPAVSPPPLVHSSGSTSTTTSALDWTSVTPTSSSASSFNDDDAKVTLTLPLATIAAFSTSAPSLPPTPIQSHTTTSFDKATLPLPDHPQNQQLPNCYPTFPANPNGMHLAQLL